MYPSKSYLLSNGYKLLIRPAIAEDASKIIKYINHIAGESDNITFGPGEFDKTVEDEREFLKKINKTPTNILIIGIINKEIVSLANIQSGNRPRTRHTGGLGITVQKKYWHMGIGKSMMDYLINWAKSGKIIKKINLEVREDNFPAIQLYSKMGFIIEGRISRMLYINKKFYAVLCMGLKIGDESVESS